MNYQEWLDTYDDAATAEGWSLWESGGSVRGAFTLQRFDIPEEAGHDPETYPFLYDEDVWEHVFKQAQTGSRLHVKTLEFLRDNGPIEYEALVHHCNAFVR